MGFWKSKSKNGNTICEIEVDGEVFPVDDSNTEEMVLRSSDLNTSLSVSTQDLLYDDEPPSSLMPPADDSSDSKSESDEDSKHAFLSNCLEKLLLFCSYPERQLKKLYQHNLLCHRLREKFASAKTVNEFTPFIEALQEDIEEPTNSMRKVGGVLGNNILFTVITTSLVIYVAVWGVALLITPPESAVKAKPRITQTKLSSKSKLVAYSDKHPKRIAIENVLQDCTVPVETRSVFLDSLKSGYEFASSADELAMRSLERFQTQYRSIGILEQLQQTQEKRAMVVKLLAPALDNFNRQLTDYKKKQQSYQDTLAELRIKASSIRDGKKLHSRVVQGVNAGIRVRREMERIEEQLNGGPTSQELEELSHAVTLLQKVVDQDSTRASTIAKLTDFEPTGLDKLDTQATLEKLTDLVDRGFTKPAITFADSNPTLIRYQVVTASQTVDLLTNLLQEFATGPARLFARIDNEQGIANQKIGELLGNQSTNWIDYAPCVAEISINFLTRHQGG